MISSISNDKIKKVKGLQTKRKFRKKYRQFVVEGVKVLREAPKAWISEIYIVPGAELELDIETHKVIQVSESVMKHISTAVTPQNVLAVINQPKDSEWVTSKENPLIIALEDIQDPGNLGTIIRTAEAAQVDYILLSKGSVDRYNPKVVRATMGAVFRMKIIENVDLLSELTKLRTGGINVYGASLKSAKDYFSVDMTKGTCILIGNEGHGLSDEIEKLTDENIIIPILGGTESLNAALATGIITYEAVRQRLTKS